jgi:hypothetical protein
MSGIEVSLEAGLDCKRLLVPFPFVGHLYPLCPLAAGIEEEKRVGCVLVRCGTRPAKASNHIVTWKQRGHHVGPSASEVSHGGIACTWRYHNICVKRHANEGGWHQYPGRMVGPLAPPGRRLRAEICWVVCPTKGGNKSDPRKRAVMLAAVTGLYSAVVVRPWQCRGWLRKVRSVNTHRATLALDNHILG